jgi:asparagine synthase (glutamine-hydrolysing)
MCGIAGFIGNRPVGEDRIQRTLGLMAHRGPDAQRSAYLAGGPGSDGLQVLLLHSRLSIIDLGDRAHQPFSLGPCTIAFNGEIYNYIELRSELQRSGVGFRTTSDTEVLLQAYLHHGVACTKVLEGMWSFAIWDSRSQELVLSRDRFGEKPLYYYRAPEGLYFASEVKALRALSGRLFQVNRNHVLRYLTLGYKSLYKLKETFFEEVCEVPSASTMRLDATLKGSIDNYWSPRVTRTPMTLEEAIEGSRECLFESVRLRLRADVPLAFCLSGGVDSAALVSIAAKQFGAEVATFSMIESDERYNEYENVMSTIRDLDCKHTLISIPEDQEMNRLRALVSYHDAPVATATFYVHSLLSDRISQEGYRVAVSGTAADELYTGYYDHFLLHLNEMRHRSDYATYLSDWQRNILQFVRNPVLRDPDLYTNSPMFREHVFDNAAEMSGWLTPAAQRDFVGTFTEQHYCSSLLRNRMLNELMQEATPVILHEDDLNSMFYSVENRSPFLDSRLCDFMCSVPAEHLIMNGYGKYLLRESVKGVLNEQVRLTRQKWGFNASVTSLIDLKSPAVRDDVLNPANAIFEWIQYDKVAPLFDLAELPNHYSKFVFGLVNAHLFLQQNQ